MDKIIELLNKLGAYYEISTHGIKYEGYYHWHYISDVNWQTQGDVNHQLRVINNNMKH